MTAPPRQQGVTLIELLVTVVILGFVVGLMSGAFNQISQMLRVSSDHNNQFLGRWTQSRALYDLISNLVIDPALEKPFEGQPSKMQAVSLASPNKPWGLASILEVDIKRAKSDAGSEVWVQDKGADSEVAALKVASFAHSVEFVYLDHSGAEYSQWPPSGVSTFRALPSGVLLREVDGKKLVLKMASYEGNLDPTGNNTLRQAFGLSP